MALTFMQDCLMAKVHSMVERCETNSVDIRKLHLDLKELENQLVFYFEKKVMFDIGVKRYPVKYRGCYKSGKPDADDPEVGKILMWTMDEILDEINRDRSESWQEYTEEDWKEGLDEWTMYEPVET